MIVYIAVLNVHYEGDCPVGLNGRLADPVSETIPAYKTKRGAQRSADRAVKCYGGMGGCSADVWSIEVPE